MRSNFLLSLLRALKLPVKLLVACWGKGKHRLILTKQKDYEPRFRKNEKRIKSLFKGKRSSKNKRKSNLVIKILN